MLVLKDITRQFPHQPSPTLAGLALEVSAGQSVSIQGPSGCGKSTLLAIIAGFERPDAGTVQFNNHSLTSLSERQADTFRRQELGVVFQAYNLLDCFNVWDNIAFASRLKGNYSPDLIHQLLDALQLSEHRTSPVSELSGGEQQRVAIARALAHKPSLVLADEPTGNLDEDTGERVSEVLYQLCAQAGTTLLLVTHNRTVARRAQQQCQLHHGKLV